MWPPICPRCDRRARSARDQFCEECWAKLRPLRVGEERWAIGATDDAGCSELVARAAFAVDSLFLDVLTTSKYRFFREVGRRLARDAAARFVVDPPEGILVPVPIRADRRRARGFNQTEDFADALAAATGLRVERSWLVRQRGGPALAGLSRERRESAVRGAFAPSSGVPEKSKVLLVDDVVTTGSTARACAAALAEGGAICGGVLAMGRAFASRADAAPRNLSILERV